jgi:hypothetical protein
LFCLLLKTLNPQIWSRRYSRVVVLNVSRLLDVLVDEQSSYN